MNHTRYFAYLLRIWQAGPGENPEWRASIEEPHTHQITGFTSLAELCQHLLNLSQQAENVGTVIKPITPGEKGNEK